MPTINGERIAVNPSTGAKIVFRGGSWVPYATAPATPNGATGSASPSTPPGLGGQISQAYSQDVAKPLTDVAASALTDMGERAQHPQRALEALSDPMQYMQEALTPRRPGATSPMARTIAETVIPQTPTAAALALAAIALPGVGAERVLGEAAGPVARMLGSRLGRIGAGTAIGAGVGALTGESPVSGAMQGAAAFVPGEMAAHGLSKVFGKVGERATQQADMGKIGKAISSTLPWVGKLEKPSDFEEAFMRGDDSRIVQAGLHRLQSVKSTLAQRMKGYLFRVPTPPLATVSGARGGMKHLSFEQADKLATDLQQGVGFGLGGMERTGWTSREARAVAFQIREHLADGLNQVQSGLGDAYRKVGREFDAAKTLVRVLGPEGLMTPQGISQPEMLTRLRGQKNGRLLYDLDRSMGRGTRDRLMKILQRGYAGVSEDIPSKAGHHNWMGHMVGAGIGGLVGEAVGHPLMGSAIGGLAGLGTMRGGAQPFDPIGAVSPLVRFSGTPFEIGISNLIGEQMKPAETPTIGPGVKALNTHRAEHLAPTPSASDRAGKVSTGLGKGRAPEVHRDLNAGRLSLDETNKLLRHASSTEPSAMIAGLPLTEVLDAAEVATPEEKQMLMPLIKQRLMAELPKQQNKTLASNLAIRFKRAAAAEA